MDSELRRRTTLGALVATVLAAAGCEAVAGISDLRICESCPASATGPGAGGAASSSTSAATGTSAGTGGASSASSGASSGSSTASSSGSGGATSGTGGSAGAGGCLHCSQATFQTSPSELCAGSDALQTNLQNCICGTCSSACGANLCAGGAVTSACQTCSMTSCATQLAQCQQDT